MSYTHCILPLVSVVIVQEDATLGKCFKLRSEVDVRVAIERRAAITYEQNILVGKGGSSQRAATRYALRWRSLACVLLVMAEVVDDDRNKIWAWLAWGWRGRWQRFRTHYWYTRLIVLLTRS